ncbi:MAG: M23 family metallopeptidase [Selenomonadaceae bacterium]|nr:M23 family metallopeptidase [Selenomonadaceae bacterium]
MKFKRLKQLLCAGFLSGAILFGSSVEAANPEGAFEGYGTLPNMLRVVGWAFDRDDMNHKVRVHVYIDGTAGSSTTPSYEIIADKSDHNGHAFDSTINIPTEWCGKRTVRLYALNDVGSGSFVEIGSMVIDIPSPNANQNSNNNVKTSPSGYAYPLGKATSFGNGHDCAIAEGTPIYAIADGVANFYQVMGTYKGRYATVSYGNYIELKCDNGALAKYAHLQRFEGVALKYTSIRNPGSTYTACKNYGKILIGSRKVRKGDVIGYVGNIGNTDGKTGVHLHFEFYENGIRRNVNNYFNR